MNVDVLRSTSLKCIYLPHKVSETITRCPCIDKHRSVHKLHVRTKIRIDKNTDF